MGTPLIEPVEITAGRLHLRPWQPGDEDALVAAVDASVTLWLTGMPEPYDEAAAAGWVHEASPGAWAEGAGAHFAVLDATSAGLLGGVGLHFDRYEGAEVGYWVAAPARGRGVAAQAVVAVSRWAFAQRAVGRVELLHDVANAASCAVARQAGFAAEAVLADKLPVRGGGRADAEVHRLLPADL